MTPEQELRILQSARNQLDGGLWKFNNPDFPGPTCMWLAVDRASSLVFNDPDDANKSRYKVAELLIREFEQLRGLVPVEIDTAYREVTLDRYVKWLVWLNDHKDTTHAEVLTVLDRLIAARS